MTINFQTIKNQRGASLVATMLFVAMLTAGVAGMSSLFLDRLKDEQQINLQQGAEMAKRNIMGALSHDGSWKATINKVGALSCLRSDGKVCKPSAKTKLSLYLPDGTTALVDSSKNSRGFNILGNVCDSFNATKGKGSDECPFRFTLSWECEGGTCAPTKTSALGIVPDSPRLVIKGKFEYNPKSKGVGFNMRQEFYDFQMVRGAEERDLSATCKSIGGYFDQGRDHCSIQSTNAGCNPVNEYMAGLDSSGAPICRPKLLVGLPCPPGTAAIGLARTGRLRCGQF